MIKAAAKLQTVREAWGSEDVDLHEALTFNRKLWTILTTSATHRTNPLPDEIKNNIATLGVFVLSHTMGVSSEPAPGKLTVLITINRELAAGLRARGQQAQEATEPASLASFNSSF